MSFVGHPPNDDSRKITFVDSNEDTAILGYSGLGITALGTEPCDWMSGVLRGRVRTIEESLAFLADAVKSQLVPHLHKLPGDIIAHHIYAPCMITEQPKFYTIDYGYNRLTSQEFFRFTRHIRQSENSAAELTPRIGVSGSGAMFLRRNLRWKRPLLSLVSANDRGRISPIVLADHIASICYDSHLGTADSTVGHRCIVAWRYRRHGYHRGGGGHRCYTDGVRERNVPPLPSVANGIDVGAFSRGEMEYVHGMVAKNHGEFASFDMADLWSAVIEKLPSDPDQTLK